MSDLSPRYEETEFDPLGFIVRAKWSIDGAQTLEEAAQMAEVFAAHLRAAAAAGFELCEAIRDDYGWVAPGGTRRRETAS